MLDSYIPITPRFRVVCRVIQKILNCVDIKPFWLSLLFTFRWNLVPKFTIAQSPRDTVAQSPRNTVAPMSKDTVAQVPRDTKSETPRFRHLFSGNILSCPPTRRLRPRLLLVVLVGGPKVTAACPYPALRLDKLYATLIRCLGLWTVTKQLLVFFCLKDSILWLVRPM